MERYYLFLLFILNSFLGFSQNTKIGEIDSLTKKLTVVNSDIEKEKILIDLSEAYSFINPDSSIYYGLKALEISENNSKSKNKAYINYLLGDANLLLSSGLSRDYFLKSIKNAEKEGNVRIEYLSNAGLGAYYANTTQIDSALHYNSIALEYFEQKQDTLALVTCYQNMMSVYTSMNDNELTIKYGLKCIELFKSGDRSEVRGQIFIGLSYAYSNMGGEQNTKEAKKYLIEAEKLALENNDNELLLYIYQIKGYKEFKNKNYLKAIPLIEKALEYATLINDEFNVSMSHYNLGISYYKSNQKNKAKAHFMLINENMLKKRTYLYLSLLNSNVNEKQSLVYLAKYDSLTKLEKHEKDAELLVKYESLEKEKENLALSIENKDKILQAQTYKLQAQKNKFYLILGVVSFIILGVFGLLYFRHKRQQAKSKIVNLQKQALQLQLNPHFFFNALNSINAFVGKQDTDKAKYYLGKFSKLMRLTLENSQFDYVTLEDELSFLENYMTLEQMNSNNFEFEITVDDDLLDIKIPSMLLQPFVENSIEHAFNGLTEKGKINIEITKTSDFLKVTIIDNGVGIDNQSINKTHKSVAIELLHKRIKLYSKGQSKIEFSVPYPNQVNKGAKVVFSIPIKD